MVSDAFVLRICRCSRRDRAVPSFDKWSALRLTAMSLSGPLPRRGRVARGEWGNLAVRGCLIIWENAHRVDSRQMRQMRVLISESSGTFGKQSKS